MSVLANRQFKREKTAKNEDSSKMLFNNFLNSIESQQNLTIQAKDVVVQGLRGQAKPPTIKYDMVKQQSQVKQNPRGRKLVSTSMNLGNGILNAYGTTPNQDT